VDIISAGNANFIIVSIQYGSLIGEFRLASWIIIFLSNSDNEYDSKSYYYQSFLCHRVLRRASTIKYEKARREASDVS
jgi:hypothetical protein